MSDTKQQFTQEAQQAGTQQGYGNAANAQRVIPQPAPGYRAPVIRQSRIKDRPEKPPAKDSLSIKIELDLEVEVSLLDKDRGARGLD
jgi:hypothetical protein